MSGEGEQARARVLCIASGRCTVLPEDADEPVDCVLPGRIARRQRSLIAVGDRVTLESTRDGGLRLRAVLPRTSHLSRIGSERRGRHQRRIVAANVDTAVVVVSPRRPALRPGLIDRYLVAIAAGGVRPVLCINKIDLLATSERATLERSLAPYHGLDLPVVECSATGPPGVDGLVRELRGSTAVLVGQSGVGKSSILNALSPTLRIGTRAVGADTAKGRHTTTATTLYRLDDGLCLIDTPGIREFGLWEPTAESLREAFPDLAEVAGGCRFADCSHVHEPDCAVRSAVAEGALSETRYDSYRRLLDSIGRA